MDGPGRRHAGHAGSVDGAELHLGDVEGHMGGLEAGLHHLQRTGEDGAHRTPASRRGGEEPGDREAQRRIVNGEI